MLALKGFPVLETERFVLRSLLAKDAESYLAIFSDPEVLRYYNLTPLTSLDQAREEIAKKQQFFEDNFLIRWAITRRGEDRLIGTIGFHRWEKEHLRAEVGYDVERDLWGHGVIGEVLPSVVRYGFEEMGLNRIAGLTVPENIPSKRILEKAGFQEEGILRQNYVIHGKPTDALVLSLLREDWR